MDGKVLDLDSVLAKSDAAYVALHYADNPDFLDSLMYICQLHQNELRRQSDDNVLRRGTRRCLGGILKAAPT